MSDSPSTIPSAPRRLQFGFWTLAEVFVGLGLAFALVAELREYSIGFIAVAIMFPAVVLYVAQTRNPRDAKFAVLAGLFILASFYCLFPAVSHPPSVSRKFSCANNLKQIVLALHNYHDHWRQFPPVVVRDDTGQPMHSWRTLILPYLNQELLYEAYDFSQPWDSPANRAAARAVAGTWWSSCPAAPVGPRAIVPTSYFMVVGSGRTNDEDEFATLPNISRQDGNPRTILVVESNSLTADWFEPRDLTMEEALRGINATGGPTISSEHAGSSSPSHPFPGAWVGMADGSVRFLHSTLDRDTLRALLTVDGDETIDWSVLAPPDRELAQTWLMSLIAVFVLFIIVRHWPRRHRAAAA
ncbi:MAG: DUF1559 domain-containing protein [Pirellulaceae bacterium]